MTSGMPWLCVGTMQGDNNDGDISNAVIDDDDRDDDDDVNHDNNDSWLACDGSFGAQAGCRSQPSITHSLLLLILMMIRR